MFEQSLLAGRRPQPNGSGRPYISSPARCRRRAACSNWAVGDADARLQSARSPLVVDVDRAYQMSSPSQPSDAINPPPLRVGRQGVVLLVEGFAEVRVIRTVGAGHPDGFREQARRTETASTGRGQACHRARRNRDGLDHPCESVRSPLVFDAIVGRQTAFRLTERHRAAAGVKREPISAAARFDRRRGSRSETRRVIEDGRAAAHRQLGEPTSVLQRVACRRARRPGAVVRTLSQAKGCCSAPRRDFA